MLDWPPPSSPSELRGFLGLTGFYKKFIRGYATTIEPLTTLLRKDQFSWNTDSQAAFDKLKTLMTEALILVPPDFTIPFVLESNTSDTAMGVVLLHNLHPVAYFSKPFCPQLRQASTYVRDLHAITSAVRKWRHYFLGHAFMIPTDHQSLKNLMSQVIQTLEQQTYLSKLLGYDYTIQYKAGSSNVVVDALSRITTLATSHLFTLSLPNFIFLDQLCRSLHSDTSYIDHLQQVRIHLDSHPGFLVNCDLLFF